MNHQTTVTTRHAPEAHHAMRTIHAVLKARAAAQATAPAAERKAS